ncbi:MAG: NAD-dependent epimerase/dehydratase family protein, partial [Myxococcota bacterium]|nr:NAD-dependent epimerase/dehydratase family protein [Myxococcota bacterium]
MSFWLDRPVLVTGATGLLGSAVLEELLARGAAPVCLVRDEVPRSRAVQEGLLARSAVVRGDLTDYEYSVTIVGIPGDEVVLRANTSGSGTGDPTDPAELVVASYPFD